MTLGVLRREGQQGGYAERHSGWRRFRFYPEGDPRHDYDQAGWNVGVKQVVAEPTFQDKHYFEASEVTSRIDLRAIGRVILNQLELGKLDVLVDDEWHVRIPLEDHFIRRVRQTFHL